MAGNVQLDLVKVPGQNREEVKSNQPTETRDINGYLNGTKPGKRKSEDVIELLEEQVKAFNDLGDDDYAQVESGEVDEHDNELKELLGAYDVTLSSKGRRSLQDVVDSYDSDLEAKGKNALIFKPSSATILEKMFSILSMQSDDSEEQLLPIQRDIRGLLYSAITTKDIPAGVEDGLELILDMLDGDPAKSLKATVDLIQTEGLKNLSKKGSGFIGKLSRSFGALGKPLSDFVYSKVKALTTRPLDKLISDDVEIDDSVRAEIREFKAETFTTVFDEVEENFEKKKDKSLKIRPEDEGYISELRDKMQDVFIADDIDEAQTAAVALTSFVTDYNTKSDQASAREKLAGDKIKQLKTAKKKADKGQTQVVQLSRKLLDQIGDDESKVQIRQAWYDNLVSSAQATLTNQGIDSIAITQDSILTELKRFETRSGSSMIGEALSSKFGKVSFTKDQIQILTNAILEDGGGNTDIEWGDVDTPTISTSQTTETGQEVTPQQAIQAITQSLGSAADADSIHNILFNEATGSNQEYNLAGHTFQLTPEQAGRLLHITQSDALSNSWEGVAAPTVTVTNTESGTHREVSPAEIIDDIKATLENTAKERREKELKRAREIVAIADGDSTTKVQDVLGIAGDKGAEQKWNLVVDKNFLDNGGSEVLDLLDAHIKNIKEISKNDKKYYENLTEKVNRLVLVPVMKKAATINQTNLAILMDTMVNNDGELNEEFRDAFEGIHETAKERIEAKAQEIAGDIETLKMASADQMAQATSQALSKIGLSSIDEFTAGLGEGASTQQKLVNLDRLFESLAGQKFGFNYRNDDVELMNVANDNNLSAFDLQRVNFQRIILIANKINELKDLEKRGKFDKITTSIDRTQVEQLISNLGDKVDKDAIGKLRQIESKVKQQFINKIARLEEQEEKISEISSSEDVWELMLNTDADTDTSMIKDIWNDLKKSFEGGLRSVVRTLGLFTEPNISLLKGKLDKIDKDEERTGFVGILETTLAKLANEAPKSKKKATEVEAPSSRRESSEGTNPPTTIAA